jgi:nicotinate-nucleotide pyrophosphorylase (carboxylating)
MGHKNLDCVSSRVQWEDISSGYLTQLISLARNEDITGFGWQKSSQYPGEDVTTHSVIAEQKGSVQIVARRDMVVSGLALIPVVSDVYHFSGDAELYVQDGSFVSAGDVLATLNGDSLVLLQMERVLLNFLQHLSGIASNTREYVNMMGNTSTRLLDTRKTTPGYRVLEKYAVACGGAWNHRMGLYDRVLIKDNHLAAAGATQGERLRNAISQAKSKYPKLLVEVEVDEIEQIQPVLDANADIIMLDNFSPNLVCEAVTLIGDQAYTEASGGISLSSIGEYSQLGLDFISCGALIHQSQWIDIAFDWMD